MTQRCSAPALTLQPLLELGSTQALAALFLPTHLPLHSSLCPLPLRLLCSCALPFLLSLVGRVVLVASSFFCTSLEEVYVALSVRTVRPAQLSPWDHLLPEQLEPVLDLRQRSPFRRVSSLLIATIWRIDNYNSVKRGQKSFY